MRLWPFGFRGGGGGEARLGIVVEALGGITLVRGWCRYRRHWRVGGCWIGLWRDGRLLFFRGVRPGDGVLGRLAYHLVGRR